MLVIGCAGTQLGDPDRQLLALVKLYNTQYDLYIEQAKDPDLTEDEREILRAKKKILTEAHPLLMMAYKALDGQEEFSAEDQAELMELIRRLIEL
jgi:hypothetical protein